MFHKTTSWLSGSEPALADLLLKSRTVIVSIKTDDITVRALKQFSALEIH